MEGMTTMMMMEKRRGGRKKVGASPPPPFADSHLFKLSQLLQKEKGANEIQGGKEGLKHRLTRPNNTFFTGMHVRGFVLLLAV